MLYMLVFIFIFFVMLIITTQIMGLFRGGYSPMPSLDEKPWYLKTDLSDEYIFGIHVIVSPSIILFLLVLTLVVTCWLNWLKRKIK
jgi:hypothetical protein